MMNVRRLRQLADSVPIEDRLDMSAEAILNVWASTAPQHGSYAKTCAAMALEVTELRRQLKEQLGER